MKTQFLENDFVENEEKKLIQMTLEISRKQTRRVHYEIEAAPVFSPTAEEFRDPLKYIDSIRAKAEKYGVCKIVPPSGWGLPNSLPFDSDAKMPTKLQKIHELQEGKGFDDGKFYTMKEYRKMADKFKRKWINENHAGVDPGYAELEKDYWDMVETANKTAVVEYANDLDNRQFGSGFPMAWKNCSPVVDVSSDTMIGIERPKSENAEAKSMFGDPNYYYRTGWNLNLLPHMDGSLLKHIKADISGVNVPWLYVGMLFSTFCWHNEDNYLYSINYSHYGDAKQWYGVPESSTGDLEKAVTAANMLGFKESPDMLHHMALQVSPSYLRSHGVPVYQVAQEPGTFIITFPKAFHGGFSYGYNVGEAVNFAIPDWLRYGGQAAQRYAEVGRPSVICYDRLLFTVLHQLKDSGPLPHWVYPVLAQEIDRLVENELSHRQEALDMGIKQNPAVLPRNKFEIVCEKSTDYDDLRTCLWCKQYCIFSAIICECDNQSVVCSAHAHMRCRKNRKCPVSNKSMLIWATTKELKELKKRMLDIIQEHRNCNQKTGGRKSVVKKTARKLMI